MKNFTLKLLVTCTFCFITSISFSQESENVIVLEMPTEQTNAEFKMDNEATQNALSANEPIYIADGVVIKNLNVLDPSTILAVDVSGNKILITTNRKTKSNTTVLASR